MSRSNFAKKIALRSLEGDSAALLGIIIRTRAKQHAFEVRAYKPSINPAISLNDRTSQSRRRLSPTFAGGVIGSGFHVSISPLPRT